VTEAIAARPERAQLALAGHLRPRSRAAAVAVALLKGTTAGVAGFALAIWLNPWLFLAVWMSALFGWVLWRRRRLVGLMRRLEDDSHLLLAGEPEQAALDLDALCREARWAPTYHALFVFFRGFAELEAGREASALPMLEAVRDSGRFGRRGFLASYRALLYGNIAAAHALLGADDDATTSLALARAELAPARRGTLVGVEALVHARAGRHGEALSRIAADLEHAERILPVRRIRFVRVLQAFCERAAGGEYRTEASSAAVLEAIRDPVLRVSLDRYAAHWPELRAFLAIASAA
jgi:hypothetical protein